MDSYRTERIHSIDYIRFYAIFAVILTHTMPFHDTFYALSTGKLNLIFEGTFDFIVNLSIRFAIPFFFIIAGYLYGRKAAQGSNTGTKLMSSLLRLMSIWFAWFVLYIFIPNIDDLISAYKDPTNWFTGYVDRSLILNRLFDGDPIHLLGGTYGHLWFIPVLAFALLIATPFYRANLLGVFLILAGTLLGVVLTAGTYGFTPAGMFANKLIDSYSLPLGSVSVLVFAIFYVAIGMWLSLKNITFSIGYSLGLAGAGFALSVAEAVILRFFTDGNPLIVSNYLGTTLLAIGVATYTISNPHVGKNSFLTKYGKYTLGVYVIHACILQYLMLMSYFVVVPGWQIIFPILVYVFSLALAWVLSKNKWTEWAVV